MATEESLQAEQESPSPQHDITILRCLYDKTDCSGEAAPVGGFLFELGATGRGQRIKLGLPARFGFFPFGFDPGFLFQAVQSRVKGALLDLQHLTRDLLNALGNRPPMLGFERDSFQDQKVQRSLDKIVWLRHTMVIYNKNCRLSRGARGRRGTTLNPLKSPS